MKRTRASVARRVAAVLFGLFVVALITACDFTFTTRVICRGDSTVAVADTSLVKCSTLDSLKTP